MLHRVCFFFHASEKQFILAKEILIQRLKGFRDYIWYNHCLQFHVPVAKEFDRQTRVHLTLSRNQYPNESLLIFSLIPYSSKARAADIITLVMKSNSMFGSLVAL